MIYTILVLIIFGLFFIIYNLLNKVEKYEERILDKTDEVEELLIKFNGILAKMREIDSKKMFEADDEVGATFEMLKSLIETSSELINKYTIEDDSTSSNR
jgi:predicted Holliday junction resolvase-like endonuclease